MLQTDPPVRSGDPTWLGWVFCVIKDQHVACGGLGGDDAGVLRHVASSVHLTLVVDFDLNLDFTTNRPKPSKLYNR